MVSSSAHPAASSPPLVPPSQFLPPIPRSLSGFQPSTFSDHVALLHKIFLPPVLGSGKEEAPDSGYSSAEEQDQQQQPATTDEDLFDALRNDTFEKEWSQSWLVRLVKRGESWLAECEEDSPEWVKRENVVEAASALIAVWSGTSAAGALLRSINLPNEICLSINDAPYSSQSPDSVGVQTWGSSILFARRLVLSPESFGLIPNTRQRILELGAGTGVLSLTLAYLPPPHANNLIIATDHHPLVLENLRKNVALNFSGNEVFVEPLDWLAFVEDDGVLPEETRGRDGVRIRKEAREQRVSGPPFDERFDVIFGADIIYEAHHSSWIYSTVSHFLRFPHSGLTPTFHLFVPLRPTHTAEIESIEATFPLASDLPPRRSEGTAEGEGGGWRLAVLEEEKLVRTEGIGRADETCYRKYTIGWC